MNHLLEKEPGGRTLTSNHNLDETNTRSLSNTYNFRTHDKQLFIDELTSN